MNEEVELLIEKYLSQLEALAEAKMFSWQDKIDRHTKLSKGYKLALERMFGYDTSKAIEIYMYNKIVQSTTAKYSKCPACNGEGTYSHYDDCPGYLIHDICGRCKGLGFIINK